MREIYIHIILISLAYLADIQIVFKQSEYSHIVFASSLTLLNNINYRKASKH